MSKENYQDDLPVLHIDHDLPVLLKRPLHVWTTFASQRHVRAIALSPEGDIWLATTGGVLHWWSDQKQFTRYTSTDGLPGNSILAVAVDGRGQVWAAHEQYGLYYLENKRWQAAQRIQELIELNLLSSTDHLWPPFAEISAINCLTVDAADHLWVVKPQGIYVLDGSPDNPELQSIPLPAGTPPRALTISASGEIWICQARGVFRYDEGKWERVLNSPDVLQLALQGDNLWLGTCRGLIRVDLESREIVSRIPTEREITALAATAEGVWFASAGKVARATAEGADKPLSVSDDEVRIAALAPDAHGRLWIGCEQGLLELHKNKFLLTKQPPDVIGPSTPEEPAAAMSNMILSLTVYQNREVSQLWIGTSQDLVCLDLQDDEWRKYPDLQGVQHLVVSDPNQEVSVVSRLEGLHRLQLSSGESTLELGPIIFALTVGPDGMLWAVTSHGLLRKKESKWSVVLSARELGHRHVRLLVHTGQTLWIGTSQGLLAYRPEAQVGALFDPVLPGGFASVRALLAIPHQDGDELWVAMEQGLYVGRPSDLPASKPRLRYEVNALLWDAANNLIWVGSEVGLFSFTQQGHKRDHFTVHNSGLSANRITALALSSAGGGQSKLWIGTPCGLSCLRY